MSILFYLATSTLLWEKRHHFRWGSGLLAMIVAVLLIAFFCWQSSILFRDPTLTDLAPKLILRLLPFISAIALALLAAGFKGLKQHAQELFILFFLGVPSVVARFLPDLSPITAKFSTFLLWYTGFNASLRDVYISLSNGTVKVYGGCSGIESMTYLLGISVISLVMFPIARSKRLFIPFLAIAIGFIVNGVRVALMAVLVDAQNRAAFDYWHEGDGSLIFGVIAVLLFGFCYWLLYRREQRGGEVA
jgi:cyanoexosortase A